MRPELVVIGVNQQGVSDTHVILRGPGSEVYVSLADLKRWRLRVPATAPVLFEGQAYVRLDALAGVQYRMHNEKLVLLIQAPASAFDVTGLSGLRPLGPLAPEKPQPGAFFNYEVFLQHAPIGTQRSAQVDVAAFNGLGVGTTSILAHQFRDESQVIRLDSTWTSDQPERLTTLRFGDAINRPGMWSRSARFGGIQYTTNFTTQPGFLPFPLQTVAGEAVLPSTLDVFVNNVLTARREVPPGPFTVRDLPAVSGQGDIRVVVRDLLGREVVLTQPYYASPALLREGIEDYTYETGLLRRNFGLHSFDYGRAFGAGTYRRGLSDRLTYELHGEVLREQAAGGIGAFQLVPGMGIFSAALAASHASDGAGALVSLGFERQTRTLSFGAHTRVTTPRFSQIGSSDRAHTPTRLSDASVSYAAGAYGSFGLTYITRTVPGESDVHIVAANYGASLGKYGALSATALTNIGVKGGKSLFITYTIPLGGSTSASVGHRRSDDGSRHGETVTQVQRNLPLGEGYGYVLQTGDQGAWLGSLTYQNNFATATAEAASRSGVTSERLIVSGAVAYVGGDIFTSRRINESFGLVQVPGFPNVRVYADNQLVGKTDEHGNALIPRLRAYDRNPLSIEQLDLPLDAEVSALRRDAAPYFRSAVVVRFPVKRTRGALLNITLDDGQPIPAGAIVTVLDTGQTFPVAHNGEAYVTGLNASNRFRVTWGGKSCEIAAVVPPTSDALPHLGAHRCAGVSR